MKKIKTKNLAEDLHKPITRTFKERKVHSPFMDNIWDADLSDMQLIIRSNKVIYFLLCVIDIFSKYAWLIPLKDKGGITITNVFQQILNVSNWKLSKIWVDKGSEFYDRFMKSWIEKKEMEMFSTHNEGKSVVAKSFFRTLRNKFYK